MEALVQTHNLTKQYGQHKAVNNVNLSVRKGEMIETPGIYPDMSARDNVKLKCMTIGISNNSYIAELLKNVGLSAVDKKKVKLDEPVNGLDPQGIAEIREIIVRLNTEKNITFIISSHILGELSKIATCYGIIEKGELKRQFLKTELTEDSEEYFFEFNRRCSPCLK